MVAKPFENLPWSLYLSARLSGDDHGTAGGAERGLWGNIHHSANLSHSPLDPAEHPPPHLSTKRGRLEND